MQNPEYIPYSRNKRKRFLLFFIGAIIVFGVGLLIYQIPRVNRVVNYRWDIAKTYIYKLINPVSNLPTPAVKNHQDKPDPVVAVESPPAQTQEPTVTPMYTPTPTLVPTPIPAQMQLSPPAYDELRDKQDWNNCGPATLALYLRYYGWDGDQFDISKVIKPTRDDRNVNVEELIYYVRTETGWLNTEFTIPISIPLTRTLLSGVKGTM